jgi:hypothetical protein
MDAVLMVIVCEFLGEKPGRRANIANIRKYSSPSLILCVASRLKLCTFPYPVLAGALHLVQRFVSLMNQFGCRCSIRLTDAGYADAHSNAGISVHEVTAHIFPQSFRELKKDSMKALSSGLPEWLVLRTIQALSTKPR